MTRARAAWLLIVAPIAALLAITLPLFLRGMPGVDAEQARLCRMLLPALFPEDQGIRVISSESGRGAVVHVAFQLGDEARSHVISCRFGGIGYSAAKRDLASVTLDGRGVSESALWFLKERWLESQDSIAADPGPPDHGEAMIHVPRPVAVALQHVIGGLPRLGILALIALATALIYGLIGRINLAFGEFAALGGISASLVIAILAGGGMTNPLLAGGAGLLAALALGAGFGAVMGRGVLYPLAGGKGQPILVAGVGLLVAVQEGLRLAQGAGTRWLPPVGQEAWRIATAFGFDVVANPRLLAMAAFDWAAILGVLFFMRVSSFGRAWQASADDPLAASLCGIDPRRMIVLASALATALAALAGATITLDYGGMNFAGGTMIGLTALIAAILGGIGSLGGAVIGAAVIGLLQVIWSATRPIEHWELATFVLITLALVLRPGGLLGHADGAMRKI